MNQEVIETKQFFQQNHIKLSDFWLESCISWFHEEKRGTTYSKKDLHSKVYEQWLLLDFRDVEVPQLPPNINNVKKVILNKSVSLQMMSIVDISKSKLSQLQKIKNFNSLTHGFNEEEEVGLDAKRMLQMTLTDGVQEIKAIEYKTVPALHVNLTPGTKFKILSPITIRRGQILLEPHNVKFLGGEVEEITISHAAENVLAKALNLPVNPQPVSIDESSIGDNTNSNCLSTNNYYNNSININRGTNRNIRQSTISDYVNINQTSQQIHKFTTSTNQNLDTTVEMERCIAIESNKLCSTRPNIFTQIDNETEVDHIDIQQKHEESYVDDEIEMLLEAERDILQDNNIKSSKVFSTLPEAHESERKDDVITLQEDECNSSVETANELFDTFDVDKHLEKVEESYHTVQQISIEDISINIQNKKYGKYKTYAKFKSVLQKLTLNNDRWTILICITDGHSELPVYVHDTVLTGMTGFTATDAIILKEKISNKNQAAAQQLMKALDQLKNELVGLDCVMEIEFTTDEESPIVTKLL